MKWLLLSTALFMGSILPTQQVSYEQKQAYFKKLLQIQQKLEQKVQKLKQINQHSIANAQSLKGQPDLQKNILEEGIKIERDQLQSAFHETLIPLKENYWTCKNLSNSQKELIAAKVKDLKDKSDSINKQVVNEKDCTRNVQLKAQLRFLKLHIESLENELSNTCQPPRKDNKLIPNLDTSNDWVYGSLSPKDYQKQLDDLALKYELVKCDKTKPFMIGNQCTACSKPEEKYSLSESKCIDKCPTATIFLKANHECVDPTKKIFISQGLSSVDDSKNPYIWGPITEQQYKDQIQELKDNKIPIEECPADKPFNQNGQKCVACSDSSVFNVGTRSCVTCKQQQKYIQKTHECRQVYKRPNYDAGKNWVALNGDSKPIESKLKDLQSQNYPVEQCPSDKPFPTKDLTQCLACDKNYNLNTGECQQCNKYLVVKPGDHQCTYLTKNCGSGEFWNGEKCLKCTQPGRYDNNYRQCICDGSFKYDEQSGQCLPAADNLKNANPDKASNYIGTAPAPSKFLGNCPQPKPFFNSASQQCVECSLPTKYYNYDTKKCQQCDNNREFSINEKKCVQPVQIFNSVLGPNSSNYCCGEPSVVAGKQSCPEDRPFFDGYHCISCSKPQFFDLKEKQCKSCPSGKQFSTTKKECIDAALLKPKVVSSIPENVKNYMGDVPSDKADSEGQQVIKCPQEKPFSNGKECLKCDLPRYFNFQSGQCEICKEAYSFSPDSRECQRNTIIGKDLYNNNLVDAQNFIGKVPEYKGQYSECPSDKKYFNGAECEKCELPNFWSFDKNECRQCDKGLYFDKQARQCLYEPAQQKYKTNLDASKNIYYNGDFEDVKKQVSNASGKTQCPSEKPFFDKSANDCINCDGDSNIFNFVKNHCIKCPDQTHFNEDYHICFQNGVGPTVERMVMNSASWI